MCGIDCLAKLRVGMGRGTAPGMRSGHGTCFGIEEGQRPMTFEIRKFRDGTQRIGMGRRVAEGWPV